MKCEKRGEFASDRERSKCAVRREVQLLPQYVRVAMMGGPTY